jgi:phage terminase large subunit GpA-like protein
MTPTTFAFEQYSESEAERFLRRFKMGPVARSDLIAINHRFSAIVKTLRLQGHEITRETGDGEDIYMWRGCTPKVKVTPEMQEFYYTTPHWRETRSNRMRFDECRCCHCRSQRYLQVHHWHYDLFAELIEDLTTLCRPCHTRIHENQLVMVHFPRYVSQEIGQRLTEATQ